MAQSRVATAAPQFLLFSFLLLLLPLLFASSSEATLQNELRTEKGRALEGSARVGRGASAGGTSGGGAGTAGAAGGGGTSGGGTGKGYRNHVPRKSSAPASTCVSPALLLLQVLVLLAGSVTVLSVF